MGILEDIRDLVVSGDMEKVKDLVKQAITQKIEPGRILNEAMVAGMAVVGKKFQENEFFVPDMLISARAMKAGLAVLAPEIARAGIKMRAKVAIGTVSGDLHDIGKNLVKTMWEGAGFEVIDLGIDVSSQSFVEIVKNDGVGLIGMSALLTTTMMSMKTIITSLKEAGVRDKVKVIIGGAPITKEFAKEIGADGYAPNAADAVDEAKSLLGLAA